MNDEYNITLTDSPDPADVQIIREGLDAHSVAQGMPADWISLTLFMRDKQGAVVGGLTGGTYWGWLSISRLWIAEHLCGQNFGSRVLAEAEREALRRGCHHAYLDTIDFQAPSFYQKHGYTVYGELQDIPIGHTRYSMQKKLEQNEG